jgi:hypothetical protein
MTQTSELKKNNPITQSIKVETKQSSCVNHDDKVAAYCLTCESVSLVDPTEDKRCSCCKGELLPFDSMESPAFYSFSFAVRNEAEHRSD